jgi:gliding motility-associated-like protein
MRGLNRKIYFLVFFFGVFLLLGNVGKVYAQQFVVTNPCMGNPECEGDGVTFSDTVARATRWDWSLGDGTTATTRSVAHAYSAPGPYIISLVRYFEDGTSKIESQEVNIEILPPDFDNWKTDTTICPGESIALDPYPNGNKPEGATFLWYPNGDTTQVLNVTESGCYSVEVIMPNGCKIQNMINVKLCMEPAGDQGAKWYFGNGAGLDFQGGSPTPIRGELRTKEGTSVISNSKGELLFYTDGITIYNADDDKMPCLDGPCDDLRGSQESTQSVLIVPQPTCRGCEYLYNVFTTTSISSTEKVLTVSVVDMRREEGKGAIVEQNRVLHNNTTERLVSSRNDQDTTYWTLSHDYASNTFRIFHATAGGLVETGTFEGGLVHDTENRGEGQMKFSAADSTGQRSLAVVVPGPDRNYIDLFGFNDQDGSMSHTRTLDLGDSPPTAYGVEFSTDRTKLYVSFMGNDTTASKLVQYDLAAADNDLIVSSAMTVDSVENLKFGSLQQAPDGRIYMAIEGASYLAVIGQPNDTTRIVSRLDYEREGIRLQGTSQLGLPNFVQNFTMPSDGPGFSADGFCVDEPTTFTASPLCNPIEDNYTWDFGDGEGITGKETEVSHTYTKPGIYTVTLFASNRCTDTLFTEQIEIFDVPKESGLEKYIEICSNEHVLEPTAVANNYVWVNQSNRRVVSRDRKLTVYPPGGDFAIYMWNDPDAECLFGDTIRVMMRRPPDLNLGPDVAMCRDSSITLSTPGLSWREFLWSNGETSRDLTVTQPGTYWVEARDANECVNRDTIQVVERPKPIIVAQLVGPTGCLTSDGVITIQSISPGTIGDYVFDWSDVAGTSLGSGSILLDRREGAYTLRMSGYEDACTADTTLHLRSPANNLNLRPLVANASCTDPEGGAITFQVISGNPTQFTWYNEGGAQVGSSDTATSLPAGIYSLLARDSGGCSFTLKPIVVGMDMNNLADLGPDVAKCEDDPVELSPLAVDFPHNNYLWSTGETTRTITVTDAGTYKLTAYNSENGCKGEDEVRVFQAPKPQVNLPSVYGLCMDDPNHSVTLRPTGRPGYLYYWPQVADSSQQIVVTDLGMYTVQVTNTEGCVVEVTTEVQDRCEPKLVIPSAFSPDNNGINDVLEMIGLYLTDFDLKIYNRWGEVIFASNNLDHKWNGRYKDVKVQPGVYAWTASYKSSDYPERPKYTVRGAVTVIR